uniref:VWFA domain-containing protein n=1 Tax=Caenorhabditis tropicalis TaxID=1561998 RepID=A0A1I7UTE5_9PELO
MNFVKIFSVFIALFAITAQSATTGLSCENAKEKFVLDVTKIINESIGNPKTIKVILDLLNQLFQDNNEIHSNILVIIGKILKAFRELLESCSAVYDPSSYTDRPCGSDMSNLWLDVVAVVDNSLGMTSSDLANVTANIEMIFGDGTRIGTDANEKRTTRVSIVTYNEGATTNYDLNSFKSYAELKTGVESALAQGSSSGSSNLLFGLQAASSVLGTQSFDTDRDHYKKVVIIFTGSYGGAGEHDPAPEADRLKEDGIFIITVGYGSGFLIDGLSTIASPRFNFSVADPNLIGNIQRSLQQATWTASRISCRVRQGYLATEFTQHKHNFLVESVTSTTGFHPPFSYFIGLNRVAGQWVWEQPQGLPQIPLQSYFNWLPNYPILSSTLAGAMNFQNGTIIGWRNIDKSGLTFAYVCEKYACDTDNYCDPDDLFSI